MIIVSITSTQAHSIMCGIAEVKTDEQFSDDAVCQVARPLLKVCTVLSSSYTCLVCVFLPSSWWTYTTTIDHWRKLSVCWLHWCSRHQYNQYVRMCLYSAKTWSGLHLYVGIWMLLSFASMPWNMALLPMEKNGKKQQIRNPKKNIHYIHLYSEEFYYY